MQKTVLIWFWWSKVIWSDAAFWLRMEKDGEGFRSRVLSGKVVARRHREMREGVWADIKKRKITHFFTLFFINLKEIKKYLSLFFYVLYTQSDGLKLLKFI